MEKIVSLCKRRGFIFPSSQIYGGLSSIWDYGPLGVELKRNIKNLWWKDLVHQRSDIEGLDAAVLMHPKVWEASGHLKKFADELVDCKKCKKRFRAEDIVSHQSPVTSHQSKNRKPRCPECGGELTKPRQFNLMFKTSQGPFLRPETAQGIFVNFRNICQTLHLKLPFGIAQIGKAFRNEITTGNFTFRSREFEQMEIEYFVQPAEAPKWYEYWVNERFNWYIKLGIKKENLRVREHSKEELAHYARQCSDIEYNFSFFTKGARRPSVGQGSTSGRGWKELEGIANRQDFDLIQHQRFSGEDLNYEGVVPYIIEPSGGVDRTLLALLVDAYYEEEVKGRKRVVLRLNKDLAPIKIAVLPLLRNRPEIVKIAKKIRDELLPHFITKYDDTASIGKLYRRQDEIGTPYCITVDVQSLDDKKVTVRERDTMRQERIAMSKLREYMGERLK